MDKKTFLDALHTGRAEWENFLSTFDEGQMLQPDLVGKWSIKDVIAHTIVWETWVSNLVRAALEGRATTSSKVFETDISEEVDALEMDDFNEWMVEQSRSRTLAEVIAASQRAFDRLVETVETMSEEDLVDGNRQFVGLEWKEARPLWDLIANQSYLHYQLHMTAIREHLEK